MSELAVAVPPTAVDDWRLTVASTVVLATGGLVKPLLTLIPCNAAEVLTIPLAAGYPMTRSPLGVTIKPLLLVVKSPERV